jgi:hypothetical protein
MTSDINIIEATVTAIQGEAISTASPTDGYVLTWNVSGDGYWEPQAPSVPVAAGLRKDYFTADGYWTCPEGVSNVLIFASAGGWGGTGGTKSPYSSSGGKAAGQGFGYVQVVPGTTYTIVIGQGGAGGSGAHTTGDPWYSVVWITYSANGLPGGTTYFKNGSTILFKSTSDDAPISITSIYSNGGNDGGLGAPGLGGAAGTNGNGGAGGEGKSSTDASSLVAGNGHDAPANSGAGGGGGGSSDNAGGVFPYDRTGGNGGSGGSGYLYIIY